MGMLAEVMETGLLEAEIESGLKERAAPKFTVVRTRPSSKVNGSLHGAVYKSLALIYMTMLGVYWLTFLGHGEALFMVGVSTVYLTAYLGTPFLLSRLGGHVDPVQRKPLAVFLDEPFETWTGVLTGREAMRQILLVPAVLLFGACGMGLIISISR